MTSPKGIGNGPASRPPKSAPVNELGYRRQPVSERRKGAAFQTRVVPRTISPLSGGMVFLFVELLTCSYHAPESFFFRLAAAEQP